ncbi:zinc finger Y-chromosomal protein-like isoform X2 [Copidosoma floridanum]|uniref:zinc finger Y-chromosomal protein-like isoform X2 n=1 Tax=Copidosoma floridanum TaxID=29053 RepID=UPI0006C973EC|nr:zinc finger Y-chromosomal protein-like isoform X2 [Copidosoma floridanum]
MTLTPVDLDSDICFLFEKNKNEDKEPPIYYTVESDDDNAGPAVVNEQNISKNPAYDSTNHENSNSNCSTNDVFTAKNVKSEDVGKNRYSSSVDEEYLSDDDSDGAAGESDDNADESLGYKFPFEYLRQHCNKCNKLITRHKNQSLKKCMTCGSLLLFECVICKRRYKKNSNIFSHLKTKYDCRNKPDLHCSICDYTNIHKGFMKNHMEKRHAGGVDELISCSKCGRHFKRAYNAEEHELSCGGVPYLECMYCDFKTTYRISFKVHKSQHIVSPENGAALVNENFEVVSVDPLMDNPIIWTPGSSKEITNEIRKKTNSQDETENVQIIDLICRNMIKMYCYKCKETTIIKNKKHTKCLKCTTELLHQCGLCNSKFVTYHNILRHFKDRHSNDNIKNIYVCGICEKKYDSFKKLSRHETFCSRTLRCAMCPFTAKMPNVLKRHCQKWHFGPDKNSHQPCLKCGRQKRAFKSVNSDFCSNCA